MIEQQEGQPEVRSFFSKKNNPKVSPFLNLPSPSSQPPSNPVTIAASFAAVKRIAVHPPCPRAPLQPPVNTMLPGPPPRASFSRPPPYAPSSSPRSSLNPLNPKTLLRQNRKGFHGVDLGLGLCLLRCVYVTMSRLWQGKKVEVKAEVVLPVWAQVVFGWDFWLWLWILTPSPPF